MLLEFSSARPPGPPTAAGPPWERSFWPGAVVFAAGTALLIVGAPAGWFGGVLVAVGGWMLGAHFLVRRRPDTAREPRRWTITDQELRAGNRLGSVRWNWNQVRRVVEHPEVYLLYQTDSPRTATFDVPRDVLSPDQDAELRIFLDRRGLLPGA